MIITQSLSLSSEILQIELYHDFPISNDDGVRLIFVDFQNFSSSDLNYKDDLRIKFANGNGKVLARQYLKHFIFSNYSHKMLFRTWLFGLLAVGKEWLIKG